MIPRHYSPFGTEDIIEPYENHSKPFRGNQTPPFRQSVPIFQRAPAAPTTAPTTAPTSAPTTAPTDLTTPGSPPSQPPSHQFTRPQFTLPQRTPGTPHTSHIPRTKPNTTSLTNKINDVVYNVKHKYRTLNIVLFLVLLLVIITLVMVAIMTIRSGHQNQTLYYKE